MPEATATSRLESAITKLQKQRREHLQAIAEIDEIFDRYGIESDGAGRPGTRRGGRLKGRRRRAYKTTGAETILRVVNKAGAKGASSSDIARAWKSEGRSGSAYPILAKLLQSRQVKKRNLKGQRGSVYTARGS